MKVQFGLNQPWFGSSYSRPVQRNTPQFGQTDTKFELKGDRFQSFHYNGKQYTDWAKIPHRPLNQLSPFIFHSVIETPTGARNKLEVNKENGRWYHDAKKGEKRVNLIPTPADYGFIPETLGPDDDMVDTFVLRSDNVRTDITDSLDKIHPRAGEVGAFEVIGALMPVDGTDGQDPKVILKEVGDARYPDDIAQVSPTSQAWVKFEELKKFLTSYKPGAAEEMQFPGRLWLSKAEAKALVEDAHHEWEEYVKHHPRPAEKTK